VKQEYKRGKYWSGEDNDSRNVRAGKDLFMVKLSIISASVSAVLSS
jgi:hypothetical protein